MRLFAWSTLLVVFLVEVAAFAAYGVWGWAHAPRWLLVWLLPVAGMVGWGLCAAPRAPVRDPRLRAVVKVVVFALAVLALADAGHRVAALALLVVVVVVHALAALPAVRAVSDESGAGSRST